MKLILLFIATLLFVSAYAQRTEQFYDYKWKLTDKAHARFFSVVEHKGDVWNKRDYYLRERKPQMYGYFKDSTCQIQHGDFKYFHSNGRLKATGRCLDGKKHGLWLSYFNDGTMSDSIEYFKGKRIGTSLGWHSNGRLSDSLVVSGSNGNFYTWFDNGSISSEGQFEDEKKQGAFRYFHRNGKLSCEEIYDRDILISKKYYDEAGKAIADTTNSDHSAMFPGGKKAWDKFVQRRLYFPEGYRIVNSDKAIVLIEGTINEEGEMTDVEVVISFYPEFDDVVINAFKKSPKWQPAVKYNRRVKEKIRQLVTFSDDF